MKHGTISAYRNHGCRCDECRAVQALYNRRNRNARRSDLDTLSHGKRSTYDAGCRCDECYLARMEAYYRLPSEYQPKAARRPSERLRLIGGKP